MINKMSFIQNLFRKVKFLSKLMLIMNEKIEWQNHIQSFFYCNIHNWVDQKVSIFVQHFYIHSPFKSPKKEGEKEQK